MNMSFRDVIIIIAMLAVCVLLPTFLCGCSPKVVTVVERHDSIITQRQIDTLKYIQRDSVIIRKYGDTVFVDRWNVLERERVHIAHDTIYNNTEKPVVVVEKKKVTPHWAWWLLLLDIVAALMFVAVIILRIKR